MPALQVLAHVRVPRRRAERQDRAVAGLEVEHVPRAEHDEGDRRVRPFVTAAAHFCCQPSHIAK